MTPGSSLTWFGFSEEGHLSSFDSKVHILVYLEMYIGGKLKLKYYNLIVTKHVGCAKGLHKSIWRQLASSLQVQDST